MRTGPLRLPSKKKIYSMRILQALLILLIGSGLIVLDLSMDYSVKKITGHIQDQQEELINGKYQATYLTLDGSKDKFVFDKGAFSPVWDGQIYKGQRVDLYYQDGWPKKVLAIQLYDLYGSEQQKYVTPAFATASSHATPPIWLLIFGGLLDAFGLFWLLRNAGLLLSSIMMSRASRGFEISR